MKNRNIDNYIYICNNKIDVKMKRYTVTRGELFTNARLSDLFSHINSLIDKEINNETDNYILNVNESTYIDHIENQHSIAMPFVDFDNKYIDSYEAEVSMEYLPSYSRYGNENGYIRRDIYQLFIPIEGVIDVLKYQPSIFLLGGCSDFKTGIKHIVADYLTFSSDPAEIRRHFDSVIDSFKRMYEYVRSDVELFNKGLREYIKQKFDSRKNQLLKKNNILSSIGFPLKENGNASKTFSIPPPQLRESISIKPVVRNEKYTPEPTIDESTYRKILSYINDAGKNFERMPSIYNSKEEEDLRDHILFVLDPHFENGSATGETFNKKGKTDIQIRHNSSVVFIAECKFWKGEKSFIATIDQLMKYLTWRDTKTAIIIFVRQKDVSTVLTKIKTTAPTHSNYLGYIDQPDVNWLNYRFHINDDPNREVQLAIQVFHIPPVE